MACCLTQHRLLLRSIGSATDNITASLVTGRYVTAGGGRGRGRGADRGGGRGRRGRGGRGGQGSGKPKSQAELDAELDGYFLKDGKTAANRLDSDMDAYWSKKEKAKAEATKEGEAAAPAEEAAEPAAATS